MARWTRAVPHDARSPFVRYCFDAVTLLDVLEQVADDRIVAGVLACAPRAERGTRLAQPP